MKTNATHSPDIAVVGAGLTGTMIALMMVKKGYKVNIYEKRDDFRVSSTDVEQDSNGSKDIFGNAKAATKRSINLALSYRGQMALKQVGLEDEVMKMAIPMKERYIHLPTGECVAQPYGKQGQAIYSVSRENLNGLLLNEAEKYGVEIFFGCKVKQINEEGTLFLEKPAPNSQVTCQLVIGADGAYSTIRSSMSRLCRQNFSQIYIPHGYKELTIPPTKDGKFALDVVNALHIWPRKKFMMIALPNPDKSFTCTLFAPYSGEGGFDALLNEKDIVDHFSRNFEDAVPLIPKLVEEYKTNPTGSLATIRVHPWNIKDKIVLIGDAAHAVVPFYGQGMNCGFEDCLVFVEILDQCNGDFSKAVPRFAEERQQATDALADLSFDNYVEMRDHTANFAFRWKKRIEGILHTLAPQSWIPLYTMVAFTRIPYHESRQRAEFQDKLLSVACKTIVCTGLLASAGLLRRCLKCS